jgi:hypothetical protein
MAKYSKKVMGKEVGDGALYAPPHTMTGKDIGAKEAMLAVSRPLIPIRWLLINTHATPVLHE